MRQRKFMGGWALLAAAVSWQTVPASFATAAEAPRVERGVEYGNEDGTKLLLDVYQPAEPSNDKPRPAVVLVHGGGWMGGERGAPTVAGLADALARAGYVAFSIDYRLVKKSPDGEAWVNQFPIPVDDCRRAVRWVRSNADKYGVDATKLGAAGDSAGGHLAAMLGTTDAPAGDAEPAGVSIRVQAVVDIFGPMKLNGDYSKMMIGDMTVQELVDAFVGKEENKRAASPLFHIDDQTAAFLILQGTADPLVTVDHSRDMHAALLKAGRRSEYVEFVGAGHGFAGQDWDTVVARTVAFFDRELKGGVTVATSQPTARAGASPPPDLGALFKMHYTNRVRMFKEQNQQLQFAVLLGDSITEGFDVPTYFPGRRMLNRGIGADVIGNALPEDDPRGVLKRLDESVFDCAATDVFLLMGINDLGSGRTPEVMEKGYREILERVKKQTPDVRVHVQSVLPTRDNHAKHNVNVLDFNQRLRKLADEFKYEYLDIHALMADDKGELKKEFTNDGLHLNADAYKLWQGEVERVMKW